MKKTTETKRYHVQVGPSLHLDENGDPAPPPHEREIAATEPSDEKAKGAVGKGGGKCPSSK